MFKVGQKVVYIHSKIVDDLYGQITPEPRAIYTVRATGHVEAIPVIWLDEIHNAPRMWGWGVYECGMNTAFFRPLVDSSTEISFTTGADPKSKKWDNRARRKVRA